MSSKGDFSQENGPLSYSGHSWNNLIFSPMIFIKLVLIYLQHAVMYIISLIFSIFKTPKSYKGMICLVTGSGRGLGRELSLELAKIGAIVVCVDIKEDLNNETVKLINESGGKAYGYQCNVAKYDDVMSLADKVQKEVGRVYMLVNNAALIMMHEVGKWPPEEVISIFNVNVLSQYWTIQAFLPGMKEIDQGQIVVLSSIGAFLEIVGFSIYGPTKAALHNLVKQVQFDLKYNKYKNINICGVYPAIVNTGPDINVLYKSGKVQLIEVKQAATDIIKSVQYGHTFITIPTYAKYFVPFISFLTVSSMLDTYKILQVNFNILKREDKSKMLFHEIAEKCTDNN